MGKSQKNYYWRDLQVSEALGSNVNTDEKAERDVLRIFINLLKVSGKEDS